MSTNSDWLRALADKIDRGEPIKPCPKALRRIADELERWVPYPGHKTVLGQSVKAGTNF